MVSYSQAVKSYVREVELCLRSGHSAGVGKGFAGRLPSCRSCSTRATAERQDRGADRFGEHERDVDTSIGAHVPNGGWRYSLDGSGSVWQGRSSVLVVPDSHGGTSCLGAMERDALWTRSSFRP